MHACMLLKPKLTGSMIGFIGYVVTGELPYLVACLEMTDWAR